MPIRVEIVGKRRPHPHDEFRQRNVLRDVAERGELLLLVAKDKGYLPQFLVIIHLTRFGTSLY